MKKFELRKSFLDQRVALSDAERASRSHLIATAFFAHVDLSTISLLHSFVPIKKLAEVDTCCIIDEIRSRLPEIKVALPRVDSQADQIDSFIYGSNDFLESSRWGIPEPAVGERIDPTSIDLVLVPLVCFDEIGYRVGYGKGFYDKFLKTCRSDCLKVGLSFFPPVERIDDVHGGDVRLDLCITPIEIYHFT